MRELFPGLLAALMCTLACSAPPGVAPEPSEVEQQQPSGDPPGGEDAGGPDLGRVLGRVSGQDPLLARARERVRGGRLPEVVRRELLASDHPDHRHAGRLLQAIAGEMPETVLARVDGGTLPREAEPAEAEPEPSDPASEVPPEAEAEPLSQAEPEPEPDLATEPEPRSVHLALETIVGPVPLLLRERPPIPAAPEPGPNAGPRLVILTSLAARPGPDPTVTSLEFAGAGPVVVSSQPLVGGRVRLSVLDAGAVPGFMAARPAAQGLEVVDITRDGRRLEIEVELARGWTLRAMETLDNGASITFEQRAPE